MPTQITHDETGVQNRKTLMILTGVIAALIVISIITILVKN